MSKVIRCAIYTRKSSEEGLEQDFNSLDAQREACAAYVLSQASEGWKPLPAHYDDGGISGGTLERPALQRLLADVREGQIDIIVVYKVDRLTRSLLDFSKLVEAFDHAGTSFVSVTQSFNTTTSMGRLTLNMLLSFAQFEREVTAERIRDKIAASKAKGMWMGGNPPLGYRPNGRSLEIVEEHAAFVRDLYRRYQELGNVRGVQNALIEDGVRAPIRHNGKGKQLGGHLFSRGQLYHLLRNPIYVGDIGHKGKVYPGNHTGIIDRATWDAVQAQLDSNRQGDRAHRERRASLLAGLLFDGQGHPLVPVHATKTGTGKTAGTKTRYRYYVSSTLQHGDRVAAPGGLRLPAREIEHVVRQELVRVFADPLELASKADLGITARALPMIAARCADLQARLAKDNQLLRQLISRIAVYSDRLRFALALPVVAELVGLETSDPESFLVHEAPTRLTRTGRAVRLIQSDGTALTYGVADPSMIKLLIKARRWWREMAKGQININDLSISEGVTASYMTRVVRLAFLSPKVVEAALAGKLKTGVDAAKLVAAELSVGWEEQADMLLPAIQASYARAG